MSLLPLAIIAVIFGIQFLLLFLRSRNLEEKLTNKLNDSRRELLETEEVLKQTQEELVKVKSSPKIEKKPPEPEKEDLSKLKQNFSESVHNLRTPIAIIRSSASLLITNRDKLTSEKFTDMLKAINSSAEQMDEMVSNYLNVSKIQQGKLAVEKGKFDLLNLVDEVCQLYKQVAYDKHIYFNFEKSEVGMPKVSGDRAKVREILNNLVSNAVKYTYLGGVTIKCFREDGSLAVTVGDTGVGISNQNQKLLFQNFQQVGTARNLSSTKSTGVGLFVSKKTSQIMGGDLWLEYSEPGKGSIFKFKLPIAAG